MAEMEGCVSVWKEEEGRCQGEREKNLLANERGQREKERETENCLPSPSCLL